MGGSRRRFRGGSPLIFLQPYFSIRAISLEEVGEVVNEMKSDKARGLDGFPVECLKKSGMALLDRLVRLLNLSFDMGVVLSRT